MWKVCQPEKYVFRVFKGYFYVDILSKVSVSDIRLYYTLLETIMKNTLFPSNLPLKHNSIWHKDYVGQHQIMPIKYEK